MANATTPDHRVFSIPIVELHPTSRARSGSSPSGKECTRKVCANGPSHISSPSVTRRKTPAITSAAWYIVDSNHRAGAAALECTRTSVVLKKYMLQSVARGRR